MAVEPQQSTSTPPTGPIPPEVRSPGYPGALFVLAVPILLFGVWGLVNGNWLLALIIIPAGVALLRSGLRSKQEHLDYEAALEHEECLRRNLCWKCQYHRAGLARGVVCPECGAPPTPPTHL